MGVRKGEGVERMGFWEPLTSGEFSVVDSKSANPEVQILVGHTYLTLEMMGRHAEENDGCPSHQSR